MRAATRALLMRGLDDDWDICGEMGLTDGHVSVRLSVRLGSG
jgi:hypothetical protein